MPETLTRRPSIDHGPLPASLLPASLLPASLLPSKVQPVPDPDIAFINVQSVLAGQSGMGCYHAHPILPLAPTSAYHSPQNGGTQCAALAEIAGYLHRR